MIGSDEFQARSAKTANQPTGDISDVEFIETLLATSSSTQSEVGFLIDIVCPQPPSKRRRGSTSKNTQPPTNTPKRGKK